MQSIQYISCPRQHCETHQLSWNRLLWEVEQSWWNTWKPWDKKGEHVLPEAPYTPLGLKALYTLSYNAHRHRQTVGEETCFYGGGYLCLCIWRTMPSGHVWQEKMKERWRVWLPQSGLQNTGPSGSSRLAWDDLALQTKLLLFFKLAYFILVTNDQCLTSCGSRFTP